MGVNYLDSAWHCGIIYMKLAALFTYLKVAPDVFLPYKPNPRDAEVQD